MKRLALKIIKFSVITLLLFALYVLVARQLFTLPSIENRLDSHVLTAPNTSPWAQYINKLAQQHPKQSGIKPLASGLDAFIMRLLLIEKAQVSIDAQYYIWHNDLTGLWLLQALQKAADRGVRVRLLLDDNGIDGLDAIIHQLNQHELIDIRLYNPFVVRQLKLINFSWDFFRLNHRMHNKAMIVDGLAAIVGGRNIGDEYFDTGLNRHYNDLDVLAIGQVIPDIAANFDLFYNSQLAIPADQIIKPNRTSSDFLGQVLKPLKKSQQFHAYQQAIIDSDLAQAIPNHDIVTTWSDVTLISDHPQKSLGVNRKDVLMVTRLSEILESPQTKVDIVTPYFVLAKSVNLFANLTARGVKVRILTNSFEANDVIPVHAGYAKYRKPLLKAGVQLYELKVNHAIEENKADLGFMGSSGASLHAKTFAVDERLVFVGSFNFDPRSARLNTEMGVVIDNPRLAQNIHKHFQQDLQRQAYRLELDQDGNIIWLEYQSPDDNKIYHEDPNSTALHRMMLTLIGWLPIQKLL